MYRTGKLLGFLSYLQLKQLQQASYKLYNGIFSSKLVFEILLDLMQEHKLTRGWQSGWIAAVCVVLLRFKYRTIISIVQGGIWPPGYNIGVILSIFKHYLIFSTASTSEETWQNTVTRIVFSEIENVLTCCICL